MLRDWSDPYLLVFCVELFSFSLTQFYKELLKACHYFLTSISKSGLMEWVKV